MIGAVVLFPTATLAQAIERNPPPAPQPLEPTIAPPPAPPPDQDATPLGPALTGIVVLGGADAAIASPPVGVDVSRTPRLAKDTRALSRFLGRPLSRKLIAEIEAQIARQYRRAGFPFVNLSTPEQDITTGVLQVRVLEFRLGSKTAPGMKPGEAAYVLSRVRVASGQPIDANQLAQDLDWLNRYPFRRTEAQFTPGSSAGQTDLLLQTTTVKPWSIYAGYANSGSPLTGIDRYFAGFQAALPGLRDALASYQFTGSSDAVFDNDQLFHSAAAPAYVSDAARLVIPTLPRQDIEASFDFVRTNQPVQAFVARQSIYEATMAYRAALSDLAPALPGEAVVGFEAKRDDSQTLFGGTAVKASSIDVFQLTVGYADQATDQFGRTSGELTLHLSPGALDRTNTDAAFSAFSNGRSGAARYAYVGGDVTRFTRLPAVFGASGFALVDTLIGQYSAGPLPQTEQSGLGGASLVRGYTLDDGAFDTAIVSRNELRAPPFALLRLKGGLADQASPYAFFDAGYGRDQRTGVSAHMASAGVAMDDLLGPHLAATLDGAWALERAGLTAAGALRLETHVTLTF